METRETLAVGDDLHFYTFQRKIEHGPIDTIKSLLEEAEKEGITHLWLMPNTEISRRLSSPGENPQGWNIVFGYSGLQINYISARRDEKRHEDRIQIGFTDNHLTYWPWEPDSARTLLATITYLENFLKMPIEWTPAHMALECLKIQNYGRWDWLRPMKLDLEEIFAPFQYKNTCPEIHFKHRLDRRGRYLIKIDKNSAHPAACTGLRCGEGDPVPGGPEDYDGRQPGFWRVRCKTVGSAWDGMRLPDLSRQYMSTDLIEQLRKSGYQISISNGYYWKEYHQTLRSTMNDLWKFRRSFRTMSERSMGHERAYLSFNAIMHALPGRLGDSDSRSQRFLRRDLWALIVSRSIATMIYNIEDIKTKTGLYPVLIDVDALWYQVDSPDPVKIFGLDILDRSKLGGFKDVYVVRVDKEIEQAFSDDSLKPRKVAGIVNGKELERQNKVQLCK